MESSQRLPMGIRDSIDDCGIVYSSNKYRETEGIKDLFNKSHSYSYAVLCFETAWFKAHYPTYFFKALFNLNKDKAGAINKYILDAKSFNVVVDPPHINHSGINFTVDENSVLFGLSAITGIGTNMAEQIINERDANGKFNSLNDFINRVNPTKAQVIALIKAGAIPAKDKKTCLVKYLLSLYEPLSFKPVAKAPSYKELLMTYNIDAEKYRTGSKRFDYDKEAILQAYNTRKKELFDQQQELRLQKYKDENDKYLQNEQFWEFEALQIFINDNPFEQSYEYMSRPFEDVESGEECTIVGIIAKIQKKKDKNSKQFAYVNIYSSFGLTEAIIWHSTFKEYEDVIKKGSQIAMLCKKDTDEKVVAKKIKPYNQWLQDIKKVKGIA